MHHTLIWCTKDTIHENNKKEICPDHLAVCGKENDSISLQHLKKIYTAYLSETNTHSIVWLFTHQIIWSIWNARYHNWFDRYKVCNDSSCSICYCQHSRHSTFKTVLCIFKCEIDIAITLRLYTMTIFRWADGTYMSIVYALHADVAVYEIMTTHSTWIIFLTNIQFLGCCVHLPL